MKKILVAGIGNIFHGDDGFGVEVAKQLMEEELPGTVQVADMGIRSYDLAYAMMDDYEAVILVDATQRDRPPGTLYLIEPDLDELDQHGGAVVNGHSMNPVRALRLVQTLGGAPPEQLYLVACEPAVLETDEDRLGLSDTVKAVVPEAIDMVQSLLGDLLQDADAAYQSATAQH